MASFTSLSSNAQSLYLDLLSSLEDEALSEIVGTVIEKEINGKVYLYDNYRLGTRAVHRYIGLKTDALSERLARIRTDAEARKARRAERSKLIKQLRAEKVISPDLQTGKTLAAMARAGVFRLGGVLVGTNAFRAYELEVGARFATGDTGATRDIDIAGFERFSLAVGDFTDPDIGKALEDLGYQSRKTLDPGQSWRWQIASDGGAREVEFLTPSFEEEEPVKYLDAMQVNAKSLHFLNYLIRDPIRAALTYRDGILVKVPRPERFAIHKLIVAHRRGSRSPVKARKDLNQAALLIQILHETRPFDLEEAFDEAMNEGPRWRECLDGSLRIRPELRPLLAG